MLKTILQRGKALRERAGMGASALASAPAFAPAFALAVSLSLVLAPFVQLVSDCAGSGSGGCGV